MRYRALVLMLGLAACSGTIDPPPPPAGVNVVGTYELSAIKGAALPWMLSQGATSRTEVIAGSVTLTAGFTYNRTTVQRITTASGSTDNPVTSSGTYTKTLDGNVTLTATFNGQTSITTGAVTGTTLVLTVTNDAWRYER